MKSEMGKRERRGWRMAGVTVLSLGFGTALLMTALSQVTSVAAVEIPVKSAVATSTDTVSIQFVADKKGAKGTGTLKGVVTYEGAVPKRPVLVKKGDPTVKAEDRAVCASEEHLSEALIVDSETKGIANVFVYLAKAPAGAKSATPKDPVVFDQKECHFLPHALTVRVKQTLLVKSDDPIAHNTHTFPVRNSGFNQVIKAGDRKGVPLVYTKAEKLPVQVKCDFHPWMVAYHLPLDHGFMAITNEKGEFEIPDLPAGSHKFIVWQEKAGYLDRSFTVDVKAGKTTDAKLSFGASKFAVFQGPQPKTITVSSID
jgi:hypothetical protein